MTERKKPNNKRLILMIVLLAVVIALMWLLPDGSHPAAPRNERSEDRTDQEYERCARRHRGYDPC
mgnify:CR=1 FL=1